MENKNTRDKVLWVAAVILAAVLAVLLSWYYYQQSTYQMPKTPATQPTQPTVQPPVQPFLMSSSDATSDILKDFNAIVIGDIDKDFEEVDADINQL
jgi:cytoskeletal protein RodZ